jgi:hypothetical protein
MPEGSRSLVCSPLPSSARLHSCLTACYLRPFPRSCLMECHALNLRVVYVDTCVNISGAQLHPDTNTDVPHPRRDPFGDGRWIRPAFKPGRRDPPLSEVELFRRNRELGARLSRDGAESARAGLCSSHGLFTPPMPWKTPPSDQARTEPACHCFPGWFGHDCERADGPLDLGHRASKQSCVHGCSGRGACRLNFCDCVPGTWGVDCSSGAPDAAAAEAAMHRAQAQRGRVGVWPIAGWTAGMRVAAPTVPIHQLHSATAVSDDLSLGSAQKAILGGVPLITRRHESTPGAISAAGDASACRRASARVRIYVYELPPRFNIWLAAHFRRPGRWDQSYLYSLDLKIHRWVGAGGAQLYIPRGDGSRTSPLRSSRHTGGVWTGAGRIAMGAGRIESSLKHKRGWGHTPTASLVVEGLSPKHAEGRGQAREPQTCPDLPPPSASSPHLCLARPAPEPPSPTHPPSLGLPPTHPGTPGPNTLPLTLIPAGGSSPPRTARSTPTRPTSSTCPPTSPSASTTQISVSTG